MDVLHIPQVAASRAMMIVGGCELASRLVASYVGDYIKGRLMVVYVIFCVVLGIQNAVCSQAYTYIHLLLYAAGEAWGFLPLVTCSCISHYSCYCFFFHFLSTPLLPTNVILFLC